MEYEKTVWIDESEPANDADNLNKIETGIENAHKYLDDLANTISLGGIF
jgi:hypothetical protein